MRTQNLPLILCLLVVGACSAFGQSKDTRMRMQGYINPAEIVSMDSSWSLEQALSVLNDMAKEHANKVIVYSEKSKRPIGVQIVNQQWRDALEIILKANGLWYEETADYIRIVTAGEEGAKGPVPPGAVGTPAEPKPKLGDRDVKISAVFFSANITKLQSYGISWDFFRPAQQNQPSVSSRFNSNVNSLDQSDTVRNDAVLGGSSPPSFTFANIDALIKFFGENDLGEVITSPDLIVRNNKKGKIQVGRTIYITTRDIAGNTIQQPVETGSIIEVTPSVYSENDTDFIALDLTVNNSTVNADNSINQSSVKTYALLYSGEETSIGGLYTTQDQTTRQGIPFLKDLPPWVLGLRYLFGSEEISKTKNELIILLKVELTPSIRSRQLRGGQGDVIDKKRKEYEQEYDKH